ncbi:MAG: hypothetical protein H0T78_11845, partial [Longispora sp.]|nr:hypothetical protein [Longispora sp. (in: high G+C Gram-positive bacteria)]
GIVSLVARGRMPWMLGLLAASWLLPVLTHALHVDVVSLVVFVLGVASLLRIGSTVVDRLVPAIGVAISVIIVAGLLFSVWPWGLAPVPVAGLLLSGLVLVGVATNRRPALPRKVLGSDLLVLGFGLVGGLVVMLPTLGGGVSARLMLATLTGDRVRHFNMFDAIQQVGGYLFLNVKQAQLIVDSSFVLTYPTGMHFVYAFTDVFVRSGQGAGAPFTEANRYAGYVICGYAFLVLATVWAARWVAGPALAGWRRALLCSLVGTFLVTGVLTTLIWSGFDSEVFGLALLAIFAAVLARPPRAVGEQVFIIAALAVAVSFTYTLFVVFVGVGVVCAAFCYRRRLRRAWRLTAVVAAVSTPIALLPVLLPRLHGFDAPNHLLASGSVVNTPRRLLFAIAVVVAAGLTTRASRRVPGLQAFAGLVVMGGVMCWGIWAYIKVQTGLSTLYYLEKAIHAQLILLLVGVGLAVLRIRSEPSRTRRGGKQLGAAALAVSIGILAAGGVSLGQTEFRYAAMLPGVDTTWGRVWTSGEWFSAPHRNALLTLGRAGYVGDGKPTIVIFDDVGIVNTHLTLIMAAFNRNVGQWGWWIYTMDGTGGLATLAQPGDQAPEEKRKNLLWLEKTIRNQAFPLRLIVSNPNVAEWFRSFATANPAIQLEVVYMPQLPRAGGGW